MTHKNDLTHFTAEWLSGEVNNPSTSAMENNENDLHLKTDKTVVFEESELFPTEGESSYLLEASANEVDEIEAQPGWFDRVHGAAMTAKASFSDQIDYYDPEKDEII